MPSEHSPFQVACNLSHLPGLILLETATTSHHGGLSMVTAAPHKVLRGHIATDWQLIADEVSAHSIADPGPHGAPAGGLFGWVGFDGEFCFGVYSDVLVFDHRQQTWSELGQLSAQFSCRNLGPAPQLRFVPVIQRDAFIASVTSAQAYIAAGDIYQVNLAHPWLAQWPDGSDPLAFYRRLQQSSPAPFAAFLSLNGTDVFSSSPECFLRMSGRQIETRPIKGTRPRFPSNAAKDKASAQALVASVKEQAELLMITDLERNDLGQVCEFGSVHVPELAAVESFAQVFHLVSTVRGTLRPGVDQTTAFKACFPGGSISGAPKKRALEIIAELERHPRGLYTGAIGYFGFNGESQFNIVIRTAIRQGQTITFHAGAGIVADSVPEHEYEETLHKAAGILGAANGQAKKILVSAQGTHED